MKPFLRHPSRKRVVIGGLALGVALLTGMSLAACSASTAPATGAQPTSTPTAQTLGKRDHLVRVVSVSGDTLTVTTSADKKGQQLTLTVSSATKITEYGQPATLSDIQPDEWLQVRGADTGHIQQISILGFGASGRIQALNDGGFTLLNSKHSGTGTVTVNVSSSTKMQEGQVQISLRDLQPGENVAVFGDKASAGSLNARLVRVALAGGQVTAINGSTISLSRGIKGTQISVTTSAATKYYLAGQPVPASQLHVGDTVGVAGAVSNKASVAATAIFIREPHVAGKVTTASGNTITMQAKGGITWTVTVDSSTKYLKDGQPASLADVQVGSEIGVVGVQSGDHALTAAVIHIHARK